MAYQLGLGALVLALPLAAAPAVATIRPAATPAPAPAARSCDSAAIGTGSSSVEVNSDDSRRTTVVRFRDHGCDVSLFASGTFALNDALTDVQSVSRDGFVRVTEDDGDHVRRYQVSQGAGGALERSYAVDGQPHAFDADAQRWLAGILLAVERHSAFAAPSRVHALLAKGGVPAVLAEIANVEGDYARGVYYNTLLDSARLNDAEARQLLAQAGRDIHSDYSLRQVLSGVSAHGLIDEATMPAYVAAIDGIGSDYERHQALSALLDSHATISPALASDIIRAGSKISSDYEESEFLIAAAKRGLLTDQTRAAFFDAVKGISSDYDHRRVLTAALGAGTPSRETVIAILQSVPSIKSDYDRTETLVAVARAFPLDSAMRQAYIKAADAIQSDYEHHRALSALLATSDRSQ